MLEERKMILTMLEKGTITAEEAVKLLQAISESTEESTDDKSYNVQESIKEASQDMRQAVREATQASKEVLKDVRENVKIALRESRRTLQMHRNQKHWKDCFEKVKESAPELADAWEKAEDDFEKAKKMMLNVSVLEDKIKNLKKEREQVVNEEQINEIKLQISEVEIEKNELLQDAQSLAAQAEEALLNVRRQCRKKGLLGEHIADNNGSVSGNLDQVGEIVNNITKQIGPMINQVLGSINIGSSDSGVEVVEEITGKFSDTMRPAVVNVSVQNGTIRLHGYDKADVKVILRKRIRNVEKSKIEEVAKKLVQVDFGDNVLNIDVIRHFGSRHAVNVEIYLPQQTYDLNLRSLNGKIALHDLVGGKWLLTTVNGKIKLENCKVESIQAASTNGSIKAEIDGQDIKLNTTNGSIRYWAPASAVGEVDLKSVNGSIRVYLDEVRNAKFEATARRGSIKVDPDWDMLSEHKASHGKSVIASTQNYNADQPALGIKVKTSNGSIKLNE